MKKRMVACIGLIVVVMLAAAPAFARTVKGELVTVDGKRLLRVWGSHYDMGYAHGYLLAEEIVVFLEEFMLGRLLDEDNYRRTRRLLNTYTRIPPAYRREIQGLYDGMAAKIGRQGLFSPTLGTTFEPIDIFAWNMIPEIFRLYFNPSSSRSEGPQVCSSISGWGPGTPDGNLVFARDLDFGDPGDLLERSPIMIAYRPRGLLKHAWLSIAWPGYLGCLTGLNERGIGATLNLGNNQPDIDDLLINLGDAYLGIPFYYSSVTFALREGIENWTPLRYLRDPIANFYNILKRKNIAGSFNLHVFVPANAPLIISDPPAAVIEVSNLGIALRTPAENRNDPPELSSDHFLAVTNHQRKLAPPEPCWRYDILVDRLNATSVLDIDTALDYEREVAQEILGFNTAYMVGIIADTREIWVSFAENGVRVPDAEPSRFTWLDLFY